MHAIADEFLLDHASGAAAAPVSLLVASHLTLNPQARRNYRRLEALGGVMLDRIAPAAVSPDALDRLMARLDTPAAPAPAEPAHAGDGLPAPLGRYVLGGVDALPWRQVTRGVEEAALPLTGNGGEKATLLRIAAGRAIPKHTHRGVEMTLVLDGAYDDEAGHYARGDVSVADARIEHQPVAATAKDCLCLVVAASPIRLTGPLMRLLNPFLTR